MSAALTTEHLRATQSAFRRWKTVLVVDQYAPICEMVARHLSASGYRVLTAGSATDAQRIIRTQSYLKIDLLLTDLEIPGMRGDELAVWIFREHPQTRVIFMSANPLCMCDVNPAICIEKPFSLRDLDTAVRVTLALDANEWGVVS